MIRLLVTFGLATEGVSFFLYNKILFHSKRNNLFLALTYILVYSSLIVLHGVSTYNAVIINMVLFLLANIFILLFLYDISVLSALLHAFLISGLSVISEILVGHVYGLFFEYYWNNWNSLHNLSYMLLSAFIFGILTIAFALIEKRIKDAKKSSTAFITVTFLSCITLLAIASFFIYDFILHPDSIGSTNNTRILTIVVLNLLLLSYVFIYYYLYRIETFISREKVQKQLEIDNVNFVNELRERDNAQRILIHDIKKHLNAVQIMAADGNIASLNSYVENLTSSSALAPPIRYCNNDYMNSILFKYQKEAEKADIKFSIDSNSVDFSSIDNYDLTVIMCNLLDNAVEAASNSESKNIIVTLSQDVDKHISMIIILNSCNGTVKFAQGVPVSSKPETLNHGLGIRSVINVLKKYDGNINMYQDENNVFHTIVLLNWRDLNENSHL